MGARDCHVPDVQVEVPEPTLGNPEEEYSGAAPVGSPEELAAHT